MSSRTPSSPEDSNSIPLPLPLQFTSWERFSLLVWKNWLLLCSERRQLGLSILAPILFSSILVILRLISDVEAVPPSKFEPVIIEDSWVNMLNEIKERKAKILATDSKFEYNRYIPRPEILYAPRFGSGKFIMSHAEIYLNNVRMESVKSCDEMREKIQVEHYLAGVCFEPTPVYMLSYTLVFPSELRFYKDTFIGNNWRTNQLFENTDHIKERLSNGLADGGYIGYIREGFVALQHAVSMGFITLNDIWHDPMLENTEISLSLIILMGYLYPILHLNMFIVKDSRSKRRNVMNNAGITSVMQFLGWFVAGYALLMICSLLLMVMLKIHFKKGNAIFSSSSIIALLLFMSVYNMASACFSLLVAASFKHRASSGGYMGAFWFITYLPYAVNVSSDKRPNVMSRLLLCAFPNSVLGLIFHHILQLEKFNEGLQLSNLFDSKSLDDKFTVGVYALVLFADTLAYSLLALFIGATRGTELQILKCFRKTYSNHHESLRQYPISIFQVDPKNQRITVELRDLSLIVRGKTVVNQVSLVLVENEITVLMGHNGSGKTLLLYMIIGMKTPTSGMVLIDNIDVYKYQVRDHCGIGSSLSNSALYNNLTVAEQLTFYCRMRGLDWDQTEAEVDKFLIAMQLQRNSHLLTRELTLGLRKHLDVCCALAGDAKIIILDEPSSGMAMSSRKLLWDMLTKEKNGRTILLTSQSVHEADFIGDRIAIMSGGILICYGTTIFLKEIYGHGFILSLYKKYYCDTQVINHAIGKYIPNLKQMSNVANEISYFINVKYREIIHDLLLELETRKLELGIDSITIHESPLSDLFVKLGADNPSDGKFKRHSEIMNGKSVFTTEYDHYWFLDEYERLTHFRLWLRQSQALIYKRLKYIRYNKGLVALYFLGPIAVASITILLTIVQPKVILPRMEFTLDQYGESISVVEEGPFLDPVQEVMLEKYEEAIFWYGGKHWVVDTNGEPMSNFILKEQETAIKRMHRRCNIGATFINGTIVAWFNNFPLHTAPLSLNLVHIAIARTVMGENVNININIDPLPSPFRTSGVINIHNDTSIFLSVNVLICFCFIWSLNVTYLAQERLQGFKFQQLVAGVRIAQFWIMCFIYDVAAIVITATIIMLTILLFSLENFSQWQIRAWYYATIIVAGCCMCSCQYLLSVLIKGHCLSVYNLVTIINIYSALIFCSLSTTLNSNEEIVVSEAAVTLMHIFPHYAMGCALLKIITASQNGAICHPPDLYEVSVKLEACRVTPNCCSRFGIQTIWSWDLGIIPEYFSLIAVGAVCWIALLLVENPRFWSAFRGQHKTAKYERKRKFEEHTARHENQNPRLSAGEAIYERIRVATLPSSSWHYEPIICDNVGKLYHGVLALRGFDLVMARGEICGVLGANGCGKSIVLTLVTRQQPMTFGRICIEGKVSNIDESLIANPPPSLGFAPQNDFVFPEFSIQETMEFFCLLYGTPRSRIANICDNIAKCLGFYEYYQYRMIECSTGIRRRLNFALALLSNPRILCLDATSVGLDWAGRRQQWRLMHEMSSRGTTILITLTTTDECECLCHRMAILSFGRLIRVARPFDFSEQYTPGYVVIIKMKPTVLNTESIRPISRTHQLHTFIKKTFPHAILQHTYQEMFIFVIPRGNHTIAGVFQKVLISSFDIKIESFMVQHSTLAAKFIDLEQEEFKVFPQRIFAELRAMRSETRTPHNLRF